MENRYDKLEMTMNSILVAIILIITAIFFWPDNDTKKVQSNKIDSTKTQLKIIVKRINIRSDPTMNSEDIGDVYEGEVYTVLEIIDKKDYYWYKIETNLGVVGYIGSDPNSEYIEIISGYIDRTPPEIIFKKEYLLFFNGEITYDDVTCIDDYSTCNLTYDNTDSRYIIFRGIDESGNITTAKIKYYNVYSTSNIYKEENNYIETTYKRNIIENNTVIEASYKLKKDILKENISTNYNPIITFYDESFNEIENISVEYNKIPVNDKCANNNELSLKEEYLENNLSKQSMLCINYSFNKLDSRIKYFAVGFTGIENYNKDENYLANYYSKYYIF